MDNKYRFFVDIPSKSNDPFLFRKQAFMDLVYNKYPNLTIAGIDEPDVRKGVQYAPAGSKLTFGITKDHDVNWSNNENITRNNPHVPVYSLEKEWDAAVNRLDLFAKEKKRNESKAAKYYTEDDNVYYFNGYKVQLFDAFIKIGYIIVPRVLTVNIMRRYSYTEISIIRSLSITILEF